MKGFWNLTSTISLTLSILFLFGYSYEDVSAVPTTHLCRPDQRDALLQFKNEFEVLNSSFAYDCIINKTIVKPHRKTVSWMNNSDCCNWEGITCNPNSGEVIELNLSCSNLRGKFHSKSSLRNLHSLTTLLLSNNEFSGPIMSLIGNLSDLTSLDLSRNGFSDFSGPIPSSIGNLSYLTFLDLSSNRFSGPIPSSIGNLYNLTDLDLSGNYIVGEIPSSFGNLNQLTRLSVGLNRLNGSFPIALLNLTKLSYLALYENQFTGTIPHNITSLSKLTTFDGSNNAFAGTLPSSLFTIPSMESVGLSDNQLSRILEFGNISSPPQLRELYVGNNNLRGPIPATISKFTNLVELDLSHYKTQGPVDFSIFSHLKLLKLLDLSHLDTTTAIDLNDFLSYFKKLERLDLSGNHFSATNKSPVPVSPLLHQLHLSGCGITEFPEFARSQNMEWLDISNNKIKGQVPGWLWTLPNLTYLNLSNNTFTGFGNSMKHGLSMEQLFASNNNFTGNIPSFICDLRGLLILDLSNNNFSGVIPRCMENLYLVVLSLRQNRLHGGLPENIFESLTTLDVGHNKLTGKLPKSLINSSFLEVLNVESNFFNDTFPFWLSSLPHLKILVLRSNAFHGPIHDTSFPKLQIVDISQNHFNGSLSSDYFVKWSAMLSLGKNYDQWDDKYMGVSYYHDSMVLMNKGLEMELVRILKIYTALDFSGNKFEGEIPRSIGLLKELHVLNLSNNAFTGHIPSSLGNLTALESLDVSQNQLSGEIPQELGELSFLSYMNFSHNQLTGLVPGGTQFQRLDCTSFEDNPGLFGPSLDEDCRDIHMPTPHETPESEDEEEEEEEVLSWIAAVIGVIPGIAFGWAIGYILFSYKPEWFMNPFARNKRRISSTTTH
ncbi:BnaA01g31030D [Brassica napus]|uniref:BnaA01g31030D protein n=1 Tax=Brassica napus TaxID=3708 RepID=A0A078HD54_BRANA|nr:BnaA01g31030D [Brassica napus]